MLAMMYAANACKKLWNEAAMTATYLMNRCSSSIAPTPHERLTGQKPMLSHLHTWGCDAYVHVQKKQRETGGLGAHAWKGIFVGYDYDNQHYYRVFDIDRHKVIITRDVEFDDDKFTAMDALNMEEEGDEAMERDDGSFNRHWIEQENMGMTDAQLKAHIDMFTSPPSASSSSPAPAPTHSQHTHANTNNSNSSSSVSDEKKLEKKEQAKPATVTTVSTASTSSSQPTRVSARSALSKAKAAEEDVINRIRQLQQQQEQEKSKRQPAQVTEATATKMTPHTNSTVPTTASTSTSEHNVAAVKASTSTLPAGKVAPATDTGRVSNNTSSMTTQTTTTTQRVSDVPNAPRPPTRVMTRIMTRSQSPASAATTTTTTTTTAPSHAMAATDSDIQRAYVTFMPLINEMLRVHALRAQREREKRERLWSDYERVYLTHSDEPASYAEAMASKNKDKWMNAIDEELASMKKLNVWEEVRLSEADRQQANIMTSKWVFKTKKNAKGEVIRHKARLVARGFTQEKGIDYNETFAPTLRSKTMRLLFALAARQRHTHTDHLDIKTAFLNATVAERVYMQAPEGVNVGSGVVLRLIKALYGMKQAPREWNSNISTFIISQGFRQLKKDTCVFVKTSKTGRRIMIGLFVDDMLVIYHHDDAHEWNEMKTQLMQQYDVNDLGEASHILGMHITHIQQCTYIDQQRYVIDKLSEFNMSHCGGLLTPEKTVSVNAQKRQAEEEQEKKKDEETAVNEKEYMQKVGSLLYACKATRPDIEHATNMLTRHMKQPTHTLMTAANRVLKYLNATAKWCLSYTHTDRERESVNVTAYCDSDWGGDATDRTSTTGFCVYVDGSLISWGTKKQATVALSSAEAEFMAATAAATEVIWTVQILKEMQYEVNVPLLHIDNSAAIAMIDNDVSHERTKHIDIKYFFIKELVRAEEMRIKWVSTHENVSDIFTKALQPQLFTKMRAKLMTALPDDART
jgi:hypothetical protein